MVNKALSTEIKKIREYVKRKDTGNRYIAAWREQDWYNGKKDAFTIILRTSGCYWSLDSGCSMCGYFNDTNKSKVDYESIMTQINNAIGRYDKEKIVKIFTSGSFFDDREINPKAQLDILKKFENAELVIVESRPEFITEKKMAEFLHIKNLMIAIGLETANNEVLENSVNKGFRVEDYVKAAVILKKFKIPLKTYLLVKPLFLTEREAMEDAVRSAKFASQYSEIISFNPINIQNYTLVNLLWKRGKYRPPWLWTILEILKETHRLGTVVSYPTAGGKRKGAHNCGECDLRVLKAIENFSMTQNPEYLEVEDCECRKEWEELMKLEDFVLSRYDIMRV